MADASRHEKLQKRYAPVSSLIGREMATYCIQKIAQES
jgi:hypothetical protein